MTHAVCAECGKEYDYDLKPGFPRKYCPDCSALKKAQFEAKVPMPDNAGGGSIAPKPYISPGMRLKNPEEAPKEEKKDRVNAIKLTELFFEGKKIEPTPEEMIAVYHKFLNNI